MIPWDDDMDVYMPRKDYERFLSMAGKVNELVPGLEGQYDIFSTRTGTEGYPVAIAKFTDMNSSIWEQERYPFVFGMFIDVFPLDSVGDDPETNRNLKAMYNSAFKNYRRSLRHYRFTDFLYTLFQFRFGKLAGMFKDVLWMKPRKELYLNKFNDIDKAMAASSGDTLIVLPAYSSVEKVTYPKEWFDGYRTARFEDFEVRVPADDDAVLRRNYGDYMQLPPKYERISTHGKFFVNLSERMTVKKIRAEMRSGKHDKYAGR